MSKVAATPPVSRWRPRWTPLTKLYVVLGILVVVILGASATGNPFGAYFAAYVSTALVIYGLIDLARKMRARRSLSRTLPILITGILTGVFMNMAQVLGWSVYLAFIIGQLFTIVLVVWLMSSDKPQR